MHDSMICPTTAPSMLYRPVGPYDSCHRRTSPSCGRFTMGTRASGPFGKHALGVSNVSHPCSTHLFYQSSEDEASKQVSHTLKTQKQKKRKPKNQASNKLPNYVQEMGRTSQLQFYKHEMILLVLCGRETIPLVKMR